MTGYVIFKREAANETDGIGWWAEPGVVEASSAEQAIRKHAKTHGAGTYIAITERAYKPVTVQVETVTRVKVGV